jgi:hypothetical protein
MCPSSGTTYDYERNVVAQTIVALVHYRLFDFGLSTVAQKIGSTGHNLVEQRNQPEAKIDYKFDKTSR